LPVAVARRQAKGPGCRRLQAQRSGPALVPDKDHDRAPTDTVDASHMGCDHQAPRGKA
jgi:hypothetical protein